MMASKIAAAVSPVMFSRTSGDVARSCASAVLIPELMMSSILFWISAGGSVEISVTSSRTCGSMVSVFMAEATAIVVVDVDS